MLAPMVATMRWKRLKEAVNCVRDPVLRNAMLAEYQERAKRDWGYCPDTERATKKQEQVILSPDEQILYDKIQNCIEYGVFEKDEQVEKEAIARMKDFITKGGKYSDLPTDLQNKHTAVLWLKAYESWLNDIDEIIKNL